MFHQLIDATALGDTPFATIALEHLDGRAAEATCLERMVSAMIEPGLIPSVAHLLQGPAALAVLDFSGGKPRCRTPQAVQ